MGVVQSVIVYGPIPEDGDYAFVEEQHAKECYAAWVAVTHSRTWREFWQRLPEHHRNQLDYPESTVPDYEDKDPTYPDDDTPFDPNRIASYREGDFPSFAIISGTWWMPQDIRDHYGKQVDSFLSGSWVVFPPESVEAVVEELRSRGYDVRQDSELIKYTCSYEAAFVPAPAVAAQDVTSSARTDA